MTMPGSLLKPYEDDPEGAGIPLGLLHLIQRQGGAGGNMVGGLLNTPGVFDQPGTQPPDPTLSATPGFTPGGTAPAGAPPAASPDAPPSGLPDANAPSMAFRNALLAGGQAAAQAPAYNSVGSSIVSALADGLRGGAQQFTATRNAEKDQKTQQAQVDAFRASLDDPALKGPPYNFTDAQIGTLKRLPLADSQRILAQIGFQKPKYAYGSGLGTYDENTGAVGTPEAPKPLDGEAGLAQRIAAEPDPAKRQAIIDAATALKGKKETPIPEGSLRTAYTENGIPLQTQPEQLTAAQQQMIAASVSKHVKEGVTPAQAAINPVASAVGTALDADRKAAIANGTRVTQIDNALANLGKMNTGAFANIKTKWQSIGAALGIGGKDAEEQAAATQNFLASTASDVMQSAGSLGARPTATVLKLLGQAQAHDPTLQPDAISTILHLQRQIAVAQMTNHNANVNGLDARTADEPTKRILRVPIPGGGSGSPDPSLGTPVAHPGSPTGYAVQGADGKWRVANKP